MHFLKTFENKTIRYDLINKFLYTSLKNVPKFKKIVLNFGSKTADFKQLSLSLLAFEFITNRNASFTTTKKPNIFLKIRKGNPTGCKLILKNLGTYLFFEKMFEGIFSKNININLDKNVFSLNLFNIFSFEKLENYYVFFNYLSSLNIMVVTSCKNKIEILFLLKSMFKKLR